MDHVVIALDGPAGAGKSTVARKLAERLNYVHADSGAMYRTVTLALMRQRGPGVDPAAFGQSVARDALSLDELGAGVALVDGLQSNRIQGEDVGAAIRTPEVTARIRFIADNAAYREAVNELLRAFAQQASLVVDGRDIGTVVFPNTPYKFFITASPRVRAQRRYDELAATGQNQVTLAELESQIVSRDSSDESRPIGALRRAHGAILIDTSDLDIDSVVSTLLSHLQIQF